MNVSIILRAIGLRLIILWPNMNVLSKKCLLRTTKRAKLRCRNKSAKSSKIIMVSGHIFLFFFSAGFFFFFFRGGAAQREGGNESNKAEEERSEHCKDEEGTELGEEGYRAPKEQRR